MTELTNLMRHEDGRGRPVHPTAGVVDSYRSDTHAIKVKHLTEIDDSGNARVSGWIPIMRHAAGVDGKHAVGPSVGDQAVIGYLDGNKDAPFVMGFLHNDQDQPPKVESGESHQDLAGGKFTHNVDKNGNVVETRKGTTSLTGQGDATFDFSGKTVTIKGATIILQGLVKLGGPDASKPAAMQGTVDTGGFSDVSNLATQVLVK